MWFKPLELEKDYWENLNLVCGLYDVHCIGCVHCPTAHKDPIARKLRLRNRRRDSDDSASADSVLKVSAEWLCQQFFLKGPVAVIGETR